MSEVLQHIEFEVKFKVEGETVYPFKALLEQTFGVKDFVYVQSDDIYYVKGDEFLRYRFSDNKKDKRAELTYKKKLEGSKNNIMRIEYNVRVDGNDPKVIEAMAEALGFKRNFTINKICHIYHTEKATLVFYSVRDLDNQKLDHFIEIEVNEKLSITEEEGWEIIKDWESKLSPLGISSKNRLRRSLFEMYRRDEKEDACNTLTSSK